MNRTIFQYRVLPSVVQVNVSREIAIQPLDARQSFSDTASYEVVVRPYVSRLYDEHDLSHAERDTLAKALGEERAERLGEPRSYKESFPAKLMDGRLVFSFTPPTEGSYSLMIAENGKRRPVELEFYALEEDMFALRPLKGDFHAHSCRSDGQDSPAVVASSYRSAGFDFTVLSDHRQYAPSREMIDAYKDVKHDLLMVNGEEVHAPCNFVHIIHFGGRYSVNEIFQKDPDLYFREVAEIAETEDIPYPNRFLYAANRWVVRKIREAGGLAVYCHPHWVYQGQHNDPDELTRLFLKNREFDAFELIGGGVHQENDLQVAFWNDVRSEGVYVPPLGSSDEHGTLDMGLYNQMFTIVFSRDNSVPAIIEAVREGKCVAVEYLHRQAPTLYYKSDEDEYNVHGTYRLVAYARFLLRHYFPCTAALAAPEGQLMREYTLGVPNAKEGLEALCGRTEACYRALFGRD